MTGDDKLNIADWTVKRALKAGADQASVAIAKTKESEVSYREKKLETLKDVFYCYTGYCDSMCVQQSTPELQKLGRKWIKILERCTLDRVPKKNGLNAEDLGIGIGRSHSALQTNSEIATLQTFIRYIFNLED